MRQTAPAGARATLHAAYALPVLRKMAPTIWRTGEEVREARAWVAADQRGWTSSPGPPRSTLSRPEECLGGSAAPNSAKKSAKMLASPAVNKTSIKIKPPPTKMGRHFTHPVQLWIREWNVPSRYPTRESPQGAGTQVSVAVVASSSSFSIVLKPRTKLSGK